MARGDEGRGGAGAVHAVAGDLPGRRGDHRGDDLPLRRRRSGWSPTTPATRSTPRRPTSPPASCPRSPRSPTTPARRSPTSTSRTATRSGCEQMSPAMRGGDRRHRGPPVLRARRRRLDGHAACAGDQPDRGLHPAGRVDADPAVHQELPALRRPPRPSPSACEATEPTYARKLREVRVALQLERELASGRTKHEAKDEVLERYLNIVFLGNNSYGVAAAARTYFNTTAGAADRPPGRAARGHGRSRPPSSTRRATRRRRPARRNEVINQMLGQGMITQAAGAGGGRRPAGHRRAAGHGRPTGASARATPRSSASTSSTTSARPGSRPSRSTAVATRSAPRSTATP